MGEMDEAGEALNDSRFSGSHGPFNLACQSFVMAANAWRVDVSEEAIGGFGRFMEFARGLFRSAEEDGASEGSGSERPFRRTPSSISRPSGQRL